MFQQGISFDDGQEISNEENIHSSLIGLAIDYLTADTLWDFKVSKDEPTSKHTLQLLVYYIMGCHSKQSEFKNIKKLGIYNPRKNKVYIIDIATIPQEIIDEVSGEVIGYK